MAQYDINNYNFKKSGNSGEKKVGYFNSLKNDGDRAVVRFAYSSINDISVETVHKALVEGKWRSISCIKGAYDPVENCPLCREGYDLKKRIFVKLLEYVPMPDGKISVEAKVWDRPAEGKNDFVKKLINMLNSCGGDLTNYLFTITRNGESGSMDTTYDINPILNMAVYPDTIYVKDFSAFEGFTPAHHSFMLKNKDDLEVFVTTGKFPPKEGANAQATSNNTEQHQTTPSYSGGYVAPTQSAPVNVQPSSTSVTPPTLEQGQGVVVANQPLSEVSGTNATEEAPVTTTRPRRVYDF